MDLFEVKVGYNTNSEAKKESYLVEAMSFTEAEAKVCGHMEKMSGSNVTILSEKKSMVKVVLNLDDELAERFYRCKVALREGLETEKVKVKNVGYFVHARDFDGAVKLLNAEVDKYMTDAEVVSVVETAIMELIIDN